MRPLLSQDRPGLPRTPPAAAGTAAGGSPGAVSADPAADASVAALRSHGWACPDLQAMGFRIVSATQRSAPAGRPLSCASRTDSTRQPSWNSTPHRQPAARRRPPRRLTRQPADGTLRRQRRLRGRDRRRYRRCGQALDQGRRAVERHLPDRQEHLHLRVGPARERCRRCRRGLGSGRRPAGQGAAVGGTPRGRMRAGDSSAGAAESVAERLERGLRKMALHPDMMTVHPARRRGVLRQRRRPNRQLPSLERVIFLKCLESTARSFSYCCSSALW